MSFQQRRYEPKHEGDPRANPHRSEYDPRLNNPSPRPEYHQYPQQQHQQYPQQQQYQYPSDDRGYHRTHPAYGDIRHEPERYEPKKFDYRYDDRFHRAQNDARQHQERGYEQQQQERGYEQQQQHRGYEQHQQHRGYEQQQQQKGYEQHQQQHRGYADHGYQQHQQRAYNEHDYRQRQQHQHEDRSYDVIPPAGRANNYSARITDLLTSIRDPEYKDDTMVKAMEANKGYLVMMRFRPSDLSDVVNVVQENLSTLAAHQGYAIGFAEPADMKILMPSNQMVAYDQWWDPRDAKGMSRYAVCCFWFKDINQAKRWFESAKNIKQPDFPNSNPFQVIAAPLTYGRNKDALPFGPENSEVTLLWSEYPNIYERQENDFLLNYSEPARRCMKFFGANPNVSVSRYKAGWGAEPNKYGQPEYIRLNVQNERVARAIRTGWVLPETFITVSVFPSMTAVQDFYYSDPYQQIRAELNRYSDPVFVAIRLRRVQGTNR